jgi:hypothetical protein
MPHGLRSRGVRGAEVVETHRRPHRVWRRLGEASRHGPRAVTDPAHARKHLAREPGDPAPFCGPPGGVCCRAHREARAYDDEPRAREVGSRRSTEEAAEQGCGGSSCGGGGGGGKAASQGKCCCGAHVPAIEPGLRHGKCARWHTTDGTRPSWCEVRPDCCTTSTRSNACGGLPRVKRDAAAGVDGQTWGGYGQGLEENLLDLSDRLARGGYRPQPVKRVYIDKADGSKRPLGRARAGGQDCPESDGRSPERHLRTGLPRVQLRLQAGQKRAQRAGRRGRGCDEQAGELDTRCGHQPSSSTPSNTTG